MRDGIAPASVAGRATLDELREILRDGRHPDGRPCGRALAERLAAVFGGAPAAEGESDP